MRTHELLRRLERLEQPEDGPGPLPVIVPDETTKAELERLRRGGKDVHRFSDAVECFL